LALDWCDGSALAPTMLHDTEEVYFGDPSILRRLSLVVARISQPLLASLGRISVFAELN
jgi:hypothetical protein